MFSNARALLVEGSGVNGDRYAAGKGSFSVWPKPGRDLSAISLQSVMEIESQFEQELPKGFHRRNLVLDCESIETLIGGRFCLGEAQLRVVMHCRPCARLDRLSGLPLFDAVKKSGGGVRIEILKSGWIEVGQEFTPLD